ncbi:MAG: hypothetical protein J5I94_11260 [Phaeodactylibacter sp.]|nr:hypothetical protein [Phaeodactylibacter sp.]
MSTPLWAQLPEGQEYGEGETPALREQYFRELRRFRDGSMPDVWQEFIRMRAHTSQRSGGLPAAEWQSLGPNTMDSLAGRMGCYAFNPLNPQTLLAGSASGGVWKTTDGAERWQPLSDELPSLRISAIAFNPADTNHIMAGTGQYMGRSFTLQPGVGLLESFDGGETWAPNSLFYAFSQGVSISRIIWDAQNIYVAATDSLWVSRDGGQSWKGTLGGNVCGLEISRRAPQILYAAVHSTGIYRSTNSGEDWEALASGLPSTNIHRIGLAISDSFPDFLLASIVQPGSFGLRGLYKTSNGGDSWQVVPNPPDYLCNGGSCLGWFVNMVAVSPVDTNVIFLGGPKLYRTVTGGDSWQWVDYYSNGLGPENRGLAYVDQWAVGFSPANPNVVYVFNDGGVQKSYDRGGYWIKKNEGLVTAQFYRIASFPGDTNLLIGGLQDHGLYYLDYAGGNIHWRQWYVGDGCALSFDPNDPNRVYGDNIFGVHYRNDNVTAGLFNTIPINNGVTGSNSVAFHFATTHHPTASGILYTANDNNIFKTTNGGSFWNIAANIPFVKAIEISPLDPDIVYAARWDNSNWGFHRSFDGGGNWEETPQSPGWRVTDVEACPVHPGVVYATRNSAFPDNPHVYKSMDHGSTWAAISEGLPDVSTNTIAVNPFNPEIVYVGTDLGVFISQDGGMSWSEYNDNLPPYYVMDMHYHPMDSTLRIGTLGRGAWKTKSFCDVPIGTQEPGGAGPPTLALAPNPFSDALSITLEVEERAPCRLSILNGLGQELVILEDALLAPGRYRFQWDGRNKVGRFAPAGLYFVRWQSGRRKQVVKVVKK